MIVAPAEVKPNDATEAADTDSSRPRNKKQQTTGRQPVEKQEAATAGQQPAVQQEANHRMLGSVSAPL
eukprot:scaffold12301_cov14-Tisochrysis_lutea.AAC.1